MTNINAEQVIDNFLSFWQLWEFARETEFYKEITDLLEDENTPATVRVKQLELKLDQGAVNNVTEYAKEYLRLAKDNQAYDPVASIMIKSTEMDTWFTSVAYGNINRHISKFIDSIPEAPILKLTFQHCDFEEAKEWISSYHQRILNDCIDHFPCGEMGLAISLGKPLGSPAYHRFIQIIPEQWDIYCAAYGEESKEGVLYINSSKLSADLVNNLKEHGAQFDEFANRRVRHETQRIQALNLGSGPVTQEAINKVFGSGLSGGPT